MIASSYPISTSTLSPGPEWILLETLCLGDLSSDAIKQIQGWITQETFDWSLLLRYSNQHKLLPLLALVFLREDFHGNVPASVKQRLQQARLKNRYRIVRLRQEAAKIAQAFTQEGIRFVATKGITLESTLYQGQGGRSFSDLDWMILPAHRDQAQAALVKLGYEMGIYDSQQRCICPHDRETLIGYRMSPDHLPAHVRLTGDPLIPFIEADVANSLTWTYSPFQVPIEVALEKIHWQPIQGIEDAQLPCFLPEFQFLFTVLHLYKEARMDLLRASGKDVNLRKFMDVLRLWQAYQENLVKPTFRAQLEAWKVVEPVVWVTGHCDDTFGTTITEQLGLTQFLDHALNHSDLPTINKTSGNTMRRRLMSVNPGL